MISACIGWFWLIANLAVLYLALTRKLGFLARSLVAGGAMLGAAAGFCNALVITANGWRMPVEYGIESGEPPRILSDGDDPDGLICDAYHLIEPPDDPWAPHDLHVDVYDQEAPEPAPGDVPAAKTPAPWTPRFAALDDRHRIVFCGAQAMFSKGDIMGALGVLLLVPGLALVLLGFAWRKIRRKSKPAS